MANLKSLLKDTAIYGLSSIVGRFFNYLLVPLFTYTFKSCGDYGLYSYLYAQTALLFALLTFGMETTFFRFINKEEDGREKMKVYSTALMMVGSVGLVFVAIVLAFLGPISELEGCADHKWYVGMMAIVVAQDAFQAICFAYLRNAHKPVKFMILKLTLIGINLLLNVVAYALMPKINPDWEITVKWAFMINLIGTSFISLCFYKELTGFKWVFDKAKAKEMIRYAWPILILSVAALLNQVAGQILLPNILNHEDGLHQLGIYEACIKIAMIMALITQAFRYAYEPFVFGSAKEKNSKEMYAVATKYFIVFTLAAFLCVVGFMDILQYFVDVKYREGLGIIPIAMAAEIMMGVAMNLSFWYKLIDKTMYGAWFSLAGCAALMIIDFLFIPEYGYVACAWGGFAAYGMSMVLSYLFGQKINPIPYPMKSIAFYTIIAGVMFAVMVGVADWVGNQWMRMAINSVLILIFLSIAVYEIYKNRHKFVGTAA